MAAHMINNSSGAAVVITPFPAGTLNENPPAFSVRAEGEAV
jgi:hypothetical protein